MTADVEIYIENKENILLVKTAAIKTMKNKSFVMVDNNGTIEKVEVVT
jgi:hypothetical protein